MKTKVVIFLVILSLILPTILCSCNSNTNENSGSNNIPGGMGGMFNPDAERPGGSFGQNDGTGGNANAGNGDGNRPDVPVDNPDLLALSYDRLKNADLSFNFDFGFGTSTSKNRVFLSSLKEQFDGEYKYYSATPEELGEPVMEYDYFKSEEDYLESLSKSARSTADYMIENITVMGAVVSYYDINYVLNYDAATDTLYATTFSFGEDGKIAELSEIKIYYDDGGDETVEMFTLSTSEHSIDLNYIYYTAGKKYTISRGLLAKDNSSSDYSTTTAIKQDGMWRAVSMHFNPNCVLLTKNGIYDYANGLLYLSFLIETEDNVYTLSDTLRPFKDGAETGSSIEAEESDEVRILPYSIYLPDISLDIINGGNVMVNAKVLKGWTEYRLTLDTEYEIPYTPYHEHYFNTQNDYLLLESGIKLTGEAKAWNDVYGWGTTICGGDDGKEYFIDSDGNYHVIGNGFLVASVSGGLAQIDRDNGEIISANINMHGGTGKESIAEQLSMLSKFLKAFELSFIDSFSPDVFGDISRLTTERDIYTEKLFTELYGESYTFEGYKNSINKIMASLNGMYDGAVNKYNTLYAKGTVDFESQPRRPENLMLINASSNLSGTVSVSESGINFSALSLDVAKSAILSEGAFYKAVTALVSENEIIYIDGFDASSYAHTEMTFTGKSASVPETEQTGEYTLVLFFAKVNEGEELIRISDIAIPVVEDFTSFTATKKTDGGYYAYTYSKHDNSLVFKSEFVDTEAPKIIPGGVIGRTEGEKPVYTLTISEGATTVGNLLSFVSSTDNRDGNIKLTVLNVKALGSENPLFENYELMPGTGYVITVCDAAGNESSVTINTVAMPSAPSEGNDTPTE